MIKEEWKYLANKPIMIVVVLGILLIPIIYAGLFLKSMWDPYGSVSNLPVAVVNEDISYVYGKKMLSIGDDVVKKLKENESLDFDFVDEETAQAGLANGTYYMIIRIPKDFSKNASTLMDENPQKMELDYETNPGTNYIASKMSETAILKIGDSIKEQVTETYTETVFEQIASIGEQMDDAYTQSAPLADGTAQARDGINTLADGIDSAQSGISQLKDGSAQALEGNGTISENLKKMVDSSVEFKAGTEQLKDGINQYTGGVAELDNGVSTAKNGSTQLASGVKQYTDGVVELTSKLTSAVEGVRSKEDELAKLEQLGDVYTGISLISNGLNKGQDGNPSLKEATDQIAGVVDDVNTIVQNHINDLEKKAQDQTGLLSDILNGLESANTSLSKWNGSVKGMLTILNSKVSVNEAEGTITLSITDANDFVSGVTDGKYTMNSSGKIVSTGDNTTPLNNDAINSIAPTEELSQINEKINKLKEDLEGTDDSDIKSELTQLLEALKNKSNEIDGKAQQFKNGVDQLAAGAALLEEKTRELPMAANEIRLAINTFNEMTAPGSELMNGISQLQSNSSTLVDGVTQLDSGLSQIKYGTSQLVANSDTLNSGATQINDAVSQVQDGSKRLYDGTVQLQDGLGQLDNGLAELKNGVDTQMAPGSHELADGIAQIDDGVIELRTGIEDGANQIKETKTTSKTDEMFASPLEEHGEQLTYVENNGHAMAAYMMSVGLWVGALAFCLLYPLMKYNGKLTSGFAWWASKASVIYAASIIQAVLLILLLYVFNGFRPARMLETILFAALSAMTFSSIMYFFNINLGKFGSFLMLIFMVIQLAGSAGTYPVELSPPFVAKIHRFLPFTYTVDAFRSTIAGGESIRASVIFMSITLLVFTALTIISFTIKAKRRETHSFILFDWLEEQGLA